MINERMQQTYYGVVNLQTQERLAQAYEKGNSEMTIAFLKYLWQQYGEARIALIWDGASYPRSQKIKDYLSAVNEGLAEKQ